MLACVQERINIDTVREIFRSLLQCVGHLHVHGKIHADLKPLNAVRMSDNSWRLIDFDGKLGGAAA